MGKPITPNQDYCVEWSDTKELESIYVMGAELGIKHGLSEEEVAMSHFMVPHTYWVAIGFSGSSVPNNILIDYTDRFFQVVPPKIIEDEPKYRTLKTLAYPLSNYNATHYIGKEGKPLCGRTDGQGIIADKMANVTCKNCICEVLSRTDFYEIEH